MRILAAIPTMNKGVLGECLESLHQVEDGTFGYSYTGNVSVMLWANGVAVETDYMSLVGGSEHNIGVVAALQNLYKMSFQLVPEGEDCIIAYFHDDVLVQQADWHKVVEDAFLANPKLGLAGFHGAKWLGQPHIYKAPYELIQLARGGCISNMRDAEAHGLRETTHQRVACVDGFSMLCRRSFLDQIGGWTWFPKDLPHHIYDTSLACMAARHGWETWLLAIPCHHLGGRTATRVDFTADFGRSEGEIHSAGHKWMYEEFRDVLPLRV